MHTRHHIAATVLVALAFAAGAGPAAAGQFDVTANGSFVRAGSPSLRTNAPAPPTIVRVNVPTGFDWGDAGIGAAGGFALSMIGLGGALAASGRRSRRVRRTATSG